jgi:fido (protein-threonine AMPylation protein)
MHRRIFEGVMKHAGELRQYDITKKEWVLENDTVNYLNWEDLHRAIDYDLEQERNFSYRGISNDVLIAHITKFVSGLWQIHAFGEGNTRTTAVFTIQYLRSIGFNVDNDLFALHSWYFRNALVRANYKNAKKGIDYTPIYLERFFRNLLLGEQWDLRNRYLHIHPTEEWRVQPNLAEDPTSTRQVPDKLCTDNQNIVKLVQLIGEKELSVKEMMVAIGLKDRENFMNLYLNPSIDGGLICLLYPESPRHPRQKYLLTAMGLALYKEFKEE